MESHNGFHGAETIFLDALVVGGGFGGCYLLHVLRKRGLKVKLAEALDGFGGVWRANHYPGARVDCEMPYYLLSAPEIMRDWTWSENFPSGDELRKYFDHVDNVWQLSSDTYFQTRVTKARYDETEQLWHVTTDKLHFICRWFLPATGSSHTQYIPSWPGMSTFKGKLVHPASWPSLDPSALLKAKRVAVIGAGASAVQIVQEAAKEATQLTQFIRTPNHAMPMRHQTVSSKEVEAIRPKIQSMLQHARSTASGLPLGSSAGKTADATPAEREKLWRRNWDKGGFNFIIASFEDVMLDETANLLAYQFWAREQGKRVPDPQKRAILVPEKPSYFFATKRASMEQDYYEMVSLSHVDVTDSLVESFDETGITTKDGKHRTFDVVVVATGYDSVTGSLQSMNIVGRNALSLSEKWANGVRTQVGACTRGYPNMFFIYGPQAPTSFSAGPPFIEQQVEWVCDVIDQVEKKGYSTIEASEEGEASWSKLNCEIASHTLYFETESWYMGANVPGKNREPLLFTGGMPLYFKKCKEALDGFKGFEVLTIRSKEVARNRGINYQTTAMFSSTFDRAGAFLNVTDG